MDRNKIWGAAFSALVIGVMGAWGVLMAVGPEPYPTGAVSFEKYKIEKDTVKPGEKMRYEFSWNGIKAAEVEIRVWQDPERKDWMCMKAGGHISGAAALLYRAEDWVESCMEKDTLKADRYTIQIRETLDYYDMTVLYDRDKNIAFRTKTTKNKTSEKDFDFVEGFDPVGAATLARSLPWKTGDKRRFEVIDGNDRWLIIIEGMEEADITVPAGTFRCIRLQPSAFELPRRRKDETPHYWQKRERKDKEEEPRMTTFSLWMAVDSPRPFVKARSDVYFGHVDMDLAEISSP